VAVDDHRSSCVLALCHLLHDITNLSPAAKSSYLADASSPPCGRHCMAQLIRFTANQDLT
jgi:hypothetical protein